MIDIGLLLLSLEWISVTGNIVGGLYIAFKKRIGFLITLVSDLFLIAYALMTAQYGILAMAGFYAIINVIGLYVWRNKQ